MTTADKYDDLAKTAGSAAGLKPEQLPGFAHILRELARSERAEQKEACARVAESIERVPVDYPVTGLVDPHEPTRRGIAAAIRAME